ncbi:28 kDa heat- and acid-stable phosphoprotein homolog [Armigeres subalbatus]|uniref:28 kDa heat- and acid-stable phosphoprotein homolog n=1 Tax=Armigeres subalbatus TaxID=124917 RepID=UPI002ED3DC0D
MGLPTEQLSRFQNNRLEDLWYGPLEELALFNFWKLIKDKAEGLIFTEPLNPADSIILNSVLDQDGDCVLQADSASNDDAGQDASNKGAIFHDVSDRNPVSASESPKHIQLHDSAERVPLDIISDPVSKPEDPFDKVLIWPRIDSSVSKERKRRGLGHVPSVATSERWLQWFQNKDHDKQEKEEAKRARMEQRKIQKEEKIELKRQTAIKKEQEKRDKEAAKRDRLEALKLQKEKKDERDRQKEIPTKKKKQTQRNQKKTTVESRSANN